MAVSSPQYSEKYILFLQFFAGGLHDFGGVIGCFLGISRNKASTVSYGTAFLFFQRGKGWEKDNSEKRNTLPLIMYHIALLDFSIQRGYLFTPLRLNRFL